MTNEFIARILSPEVDIDGKAVCALRVCTVAVIAVKIVEIEFVDSPLKTDYLFFKLGDILFPADGACDLDKPCECNHVEVGVDKGCGQGPLFRRAPIAKTPYAVLVACDEACLAVVLEELYECEHLRVVILKRLFVAVEFIELVGHGYDRNSPTARAAATVEVGGGVLYATRELILTACDVAHPLFVKLAAAEGHYRRAGAKLTVAGVAKALDMGAVGGVAAVHIYKLGVKVGFPKPIEYGVVGMEI